MTKVSAQLATVLVKVCMRALHVELAVTQEALVGIMEDFTRINTVMVG